MYSLRPIRGCVCLCLRVRGRGGIRGGSRDVGGGSRVGCRGRLVIRVDRLALVGHVSLEAVVVVSHVGHLLDAAVGEGHGVRAGDCIAVGHLVVAVAGPGVVVADSVVELVRLRGFLMEGGKGREAT